MADSLDNPTSVPPDDASAAPGAAARARVPRLPSPRASAALAVAMLAVGVTVGAAIGPTPETSLAGNSAVVKQLPALIASLAARRSTAAPQTTSTTVKPPAITPTATPASSPSTTASTTSTPTPATAPAPAPAPTPATGQAEAPAPTATKEAPSKPTLPPITSVWLIQLAGGSFAEALAAPTAAPYIDSQLIAKGTLLSGWSALSGSAFASAAALIENQATAGAVSTLSQPSLHSIVQPPCPEGAAGAACAAGTPGQLTAADEFLKGALTSITATPAYGEHGLVVVTFAAVGNASAPELTPGASTATLASQPPAGVVLLSPFALVGARPATTFNPSSPKQSLEALLH